MNKRLLVTRPRHDITTHYLFHWANKIIELAKKKHFSVLDLKRKRANKKEITSILKKIEPSLVFLNGHGDDGCIRGHNNEILLEAGKNEKLLKSKIIYALSCRSAKKLGPKSIKAKALAYLGYDDDFIFIIDKDKVGKPLADGTAKLFLDPSNQIMISLLKGHSVGNSCYRSKRLFRENARRVASSESFYHYLIPYLLWDMKHQVYLGEPSAIF